MSTNVFVVTGYTYKYKNFYERVVVLRSIQPYQKSLKFYKGEYKGEILKMLIFGFSSPTAYIFARKKLISEIVKPIPLSLEPITP